MRDCGCACGGFLDVVAVVLACDLDSCARGQGRALGARAGVEEVGRGGLVEGVGGETGEGYGGEGEEGIVAGTVG